MRRTAPALLTAAVAALALAAGAAPAGAAQVTKELEFVASDGVKLHAAVGGEGSLAPRPVVVEFSPYAPGCCPMVGGPAFNHVQVHARGTGRSEGRWSATGPRDQLDVAEFLEWACRQPWSDGRLALYGFSASAIVAYNAMDLELPCLKTAVLMAGTADLYRDLLYIGGIPNELPAAAVLTQVGALTLPSAPERARQPQKGLDPVAGYAQISADYHAHPSHDGYWKDRSLEPSRLEVPILVDTGFYDVQSRGPFEAYKLTKHLGSKLLVIGAHDGSPAGSGGPFPRFRRWLEHKVLGVDNGVDAEPRVEVWEGIGGREELLAGKARKLQGDDWPLPGTRWTTLKLSAARSGTARSLNDGTLTTGTPGAKTDQPYTSATSVPTASDPHTTSTVAGMGGGGYSFNDLFRAVPGSTEMNQAEPASLTFTTPPLAEPIDSVGPAALHVRLASTAPEADIHAVVADVWPDGSAHPIGVGRLRTSYPNTVAERSVVDPESGETVQPFNDFSAKTLATPGVARDYSVEFWPLGNRFEKGHRIRLYVTGTSGYMVPPPPGVNTVTVGGDSGSRLVLPGLGGGPVFAGS